MKITLYTIHCPACIILRKKLDMAGILYDVVDDEKILRELGYTQFPLLKVDDTLMNFGDANKWVKERT